MRFLGFHGGIMAGRAVTIAALLGAAGLISVLFQNCTTPVESDPNRLVALAEKLSFAYDATYDQIAYMSCSEQPNGGFDRSAYFTFRVGAYRTGGIRITDSFHEELGKRPQQDKSDILSMSPANSKTYAQASLRDLNNFESGVYVGSGSPIEGVDFQNMLEPLGTTEMSDILLSLPPGERLRYVRNGLVVGARFEASLYFGASHLMGENLRQKMSQDVILGLTFSDGEMGNDMVRARAPASGDGRSVYGRGLQLNFKQPSVSGISGHFPNYVLREVREVNLLTRKDATDVKPWVCPANMQFLIVRPGEAGSAGCTEKSDPALPDKDMQIIRNSFRVEDWYVDLNPSRRCLIPKKQMGKSCYGDSPQIVVKYDMALPCSAAASIGGTCAHFASICYRQE